MNITELSRIVSYAYETNPFYRDHLGRSTISTWEEWHSLPFLTRQILGNIPFSKRLSIPFSQVDHITSTSGTTGSLPLYNARRTLLEYEFRADQPVRITAALSSKPVPHQHERYFTRRNMLPRVVVIDPRNPSTTALLARAAGVDSIFAFLFHVPLIAPYLVKYGVADRIRFIEVAGEVGSPAQQDRMRSAFPNARIVFTYGLSEVEHSPVGIACEPLGGTSSSVIYHPKDGIHLEFIDEHGEVLEEKPGTEGEVVVTSCRGDPAAFPTIRYRTGDRGRIESCTTHRGMCFTILGRADVDFMRIPAGLLKVDEVERVLAALSVPSPDEFELHIGEVGGVTKTVLKLRGAQKFQHIVPEIERMLRVSPSITYKEAVAQGFCLPLSCEPLGDTPLPPSKKRRIFRLEHIH